MPKIAILGAGSWGTALSIVLARSPRKHEIMLWARDAGLATTLQNTRENQLYLAGCRLPDSVQPTDSLRSALERADTVVSAIPAAHVRTIFHAALPHLRETVPVVSATKGLEPLTHLRMSEVLKAVLAANFLAQVAVLSGPSFAAEAARGEPTAVVVAANAEKSPALASAIQSEFAAPGFRLYTNDDVLGVELAGAMKNVIAIAAGACQGLGLGANALAALVTRGLAEMTRLSVALGAKPETMAGLAGLGDLVLTCTGKLSRNRHVGCELGAGRTLGDILTGMRHMVAEGIATTAPLLALARQHSIDLPITEQVDAILHHGLSPREAIREIMERPQKHESA